ncbi:MAG TPA: GNAT family N-acetyltransferase [Lachnospiraceae bacterium]|nr:GNAT family N-acetyltransferase [Lachnospiraceae bacterium]
MENKIDLRKFMDQDMELFQKWLYVPHVAKWYHDPLDWIDEVQKRNTDYIWIHHYIVEYENKPLGFCQYYEYVNSEETWHGDTEVEGTYSIDYLIGEPNYIGKGLGKQIIQALIHQIKNHSNAKRIIVQPEKENNASCGVLKSCGFAYNEKYEFYTLSSVR